MSEITKNNEQNQQNASEWDTLTEIEEPQSKYPVIEESYVTEKEDIPTNFFVDHISRGEKTAIYYGDNGESEIVGEYLHILEHDEYEGSQELSNNPQLKSLLEQVGLEISLVDATRGRIYDDDASRYVYSKSFRELLEYGTNEETPQAEKDLINNYLDALSKQGNALSYMMYRSQEAFPDTEEFRQNVSEVAIASSEQDIEKSETERGGEVIIARAEQYFESAQQVIRDAKTQLGSVYTEVFSPSPNIKEIRESIIEIRRMVSELENDQNELQQCGNQLRDLGSEGGQLCYSQSDAVKIKTDEIKSTLGTIEATIAQRERDSFQIYPSIDGYSDIEQIDNRATKNNEDALNKPNNSNPRTEMPRIGSINSDATQVLSQISSSIDKIKNIRIK